MDEEKNNIKDNFIDIRIPDTSSDTAVATQVDAPEIIQTSLDIGSDNTEIIKMKNLTLII